MHRRMQVDTHRHRPKSPQNRGQGLLYMKANPLLSWRLDPEESLSDWTLTIVSSLKLANEQKYLDRFGMKNGTTSPRIDSTMTECNDSIASAKKHLAIKKYFVHKAQLAVGPRKSEYFAMLFQSERQKELESATTTMRDHSNMSSMKRGTRIEMMPSAAVCVPAMLDYMYSPPGSSIQFTTDKVVAIRHLASIFGMRELFNEATKFIKEDLNPTTAPTYLIQAKEFMNTKLESFAIEMCATQFHLMKLTALASIPPSCVVQITSSDNFIHLDSESFSAKIASYCRCREGEITLPILEALTKPEIMPIIVEEESMYYIQLLSSLDTESDFLEGSEPQSLFQRCLLKASKLLRKAIDARSAIGDDSKSTRSNTKHYDMVTATYSSLPVELKVTLLENALEDGYISKSRQDRTSKESIPNAIRKSRKQVAKMEKEMSNMKTLYERKLAYYQQKLLIKEDEVRKYANGGSKPRDDFNLR